MLSMQPPANQIVDVMRRIWCVSAGWLACWFVIGCFQRILRKRRYVAATSIKNKIYVIGGYDGTTRLNSVDCLDLSENDPVWVTVAPMRHRRGLAGACTYQG